MEPRAEWRYRFAGLSVLSELELPEWRVFEEPSGVRYDIVIRLLPRVDTVPDRRLTEVGERSCRLVFRSAEYLVRDGREILIRPHAGAGAREMRVLLLGSAFAALAYQRDMLCLHGSVVGTPKGALAFGGASGRGKSTLAMALCRRGYEFLSDDLFVCDVSADGRASVHPAAPRIKLWSDALATFGVDDATLPRDHWRTAKFHAPVAAGRAPGPRPLEALYLLEWGAASLARLHGLDAVSSVVKNASYRLNLASARSRAAHWARCVALTQAVRVFRWTRPRDLDALQQGQIDLPPL